MFNFILDGKIGELLAPVSDENHKLHLAIQHFRNDEARQLMQNSTFDLSRLNSSGISVLHVCCRYNNREMLDVLFQRGLQLDMADRDGNTPLHWAAKYGHVDLVKTLIAQGAAVTAQNKSGQTPYDVSTNHVIRQFLLPLQFQVQGQPQTNAPGIIQPPLHGEIPPQEHQHQNQRLVHQTSYVPSAVPSPVIPQQAGVHFGPPTTSLPALPVGSSVQTGPVSQAIGIPPPQSIPPGTGRSGSSEPAVGIVHAGNTDMVFSGRDAHPETDTILHNGTNGSISHSDGGGSSNSSSSSSCGNSSDSSSRLDSDARSHLGAGHGRGIRDIANSSSSKSSSGSGSGSGSSGISVDGGGGVDSIGLSDRLAESSGHGMLMSSANPALPPGGAVNACVGTQVATRVGGMPPKSIPRTPDLGHPAGHNNTAMHSYNTRRVFEPSGGGDGLKFQPDGFHSSSSDPLLQAKYGHTKERKAVAPPPTVPLTPEGTALQFSLYAAPLPASKPGASSILGMQGYQGPRYLPPRGMEVAPALGAAHPHGLNHQAPPAPAPGLHAPAVFSPGPTPSGNTPPPPMPDGYRR